MKIRDITHIVSIYIVFFLVSLFVVNCSETGRKRSSDNSLRDERATTKTTTITTSTIPIDTTMIEGTVRHGSNKEIQTFVFKKAFIKKDNPYGGEAEISLYITDDNGSCDAVDNIVLSTVKKYFSWKIMAKNFKESDKPQQYHFEQSILKTQGSADFYSTNNNSESLYMYPEGDLVFTSSNLDENKVWGKISAKEKIYDFSLAGEFKAENCDYQNKTDSIQDGGTDSADSDGFDDTDNTSDDFDDTTNDESDIDPDPPTSDITVTLFNDPIILTKAYIYHSEDIFGVDGMAYELYLTEENSSSFSTETNTSCLNPRESLYYYRVIIPIDDLNSGKLETNHTYNLEDFQQSYLTTNYDNNSANYSVIGEISFSYIDFEIGRIRGDINGTGKKPDWDGISSLVGKFEAVFCE